MNSLLKRLQKKQKYGNKMKLKEYNKSKSDSFEDIFYKKNIFPKKTLI
jgi:hypothetical protein